jgi:hypothetical protein
MIEICMRFAGYDKDIKADTSVDLFMEQAKEYKKLVGDSKWNKTLEFISFRNASHPMVAVRAYEINEWTKTERFNNIIDYMNDESANAFKKLPIALSPKKIPGRNVADAQAKLLNMGLCDVTIERVTECENKAKEGTVISVLVNGDENAPDDWYKRDSKIVLRYYEPKSIEETAMEHPNEILLEIGHKGFLGKELKSTEEELKGLGFKNIEIKEMALPKFGMRGKENTIAKIIIGGQSKFEPNTWFEPNMEVILYYYVSVN